MNKKTAFSIKPLHTEQDYNAALREVSPFFDNEPPAGTPESDYFEVLVTLIQAYETKHYPIDLPDPIEAIKFRMEQSGMVAKDLTPMIGGLNRVHEILNRKRTLTLNMIRRLHDMLGISAQSLIRPTVVPIARN